MFIPSCFLFFLTLQLVDSAFFQIFVEASHSHRIFGLGNPRDLKPLERCLQLHNTQTFSILVFKKSTHPMACLFHAFQLVRNSKHSRKNTQQTSSFAKKGLFWPTGGFCSILSEKLFRKTKKKLVKQRWHLTILQCQGRGSLSCQVRNPGTSLPGRRSPRSLSRHRRRLPLKPMGVTSPKI